MKYSIILLCFLTSACAALLYQPATTEQLQAMSAIDVCTEVGEAQWRGNAEAYLAAQAEASKRIINNEVDQNDCNTIAEMKMTKNDRAREFANRSHENTKTTRTNCTATGKTANCTSVTR